MQAVILYITVDVIKMSYMYMSFNTLNNIWFNDITFGLMTYTVWMVDVKKMNAITCVITTY